MQGEGKIFHRDREVEFRAVTLRLGQQLTRRFSLELDVSNQLRNINVFRRQAARSTLSELAITSSATPCR